MGSLINIIHKTFQGKAVTNALEAVIIFKYKLFRFYRQFLVFLVYFIVTLFHSLQLQGPTLADSDHPVDDVTTDESDHLDSDVIIINGSSLVKGNNKNKTYIGQVFE